MQSEIAKQEGVCHTRVECVQMYAGLDAGIKAAAIEFIRGEITPEDAARIRQTIAQHGPHEWLFHLNDEEIKKLSPEDRPRGFAAMYNPHFGFGMMVRNVLRSNGFGEKEFNVHNLDDIYVDLLEEALKE